MSTLEFKAKLTCGNFRCKNKLKVVAVMEDHNVMLGHIEIERVPVQQRVFHISDEAVDAAGWKEDRYRGLVCPACAPKAGM